MNLYDFQGRQYVSINKLVAHHGYSHPVPNGGLPMKRYAYNVASSPHMPPPPPIAPMDGYTLTCWGQTADQICNADSPEGIIEALVHMIMPLGDAHSRLTGIKDLIEKSIADQVAGRITR